MAGLDLAAALEGSVINLDFPAPGIPGQALAGLLEVLDRDGGEQHPVDGSDLVGRIDFTTADSPEGDGGQMRLASGGLELDLGVADLHRGDAGLGLSLIHI